VTGPLLNFGGIGSLEDIVHPCVIAGGLASLIEHIKIVVQTRISLKKIFYVIFGFRPQAENHVFPFGVEISPLFLLTISVISYRSSAKKPIQLHAKNLQNQGRWSNPQRTGHNLANAHPASVRVHNDENRSLHAT